MKACVKATGEIVDIVGEGIQNSNMVMAAHGEWFTKDELDIVPLSWKPFEPTYWQKLEHQYAGMAMQGILSNPNLAYKDIRTGTICNHVAEEVKEIAHALVEKYKKGGKEMKDFLWRLFDWVVGAFFGVCIYLLIVCDKPTALDVYRGKTTLEITYRDSVVIDSTVVYKVR